MEDVDEVVQHKHEQQPAADEPTGSAEEDNMEDTGM
ncbi:hypothetical protein PR003_g21872 [Phytophthora rubi]|uniref:Uncharacterized protein n=1 Tax=Phytophthora rubi TaxID=129364 RepID=A0A6A3JB89_9STRA|nr:hypothetical protein PR002_g20555 [Phytophthora rubi]KAE8993488.1 hypothetical protein PR001_g20657 [Phytophthora rubi]KAE9303969.1 hypothetical protein PR003_g21872 [Phytophthora rubi]